MLLSFFTFSEVDLQTKDEKRYMLLKMIHVAWFVTVGKHKASDQWGPTSCPH